VRKVSRRLGCSDGTVGVLVYIHRQEVQDEPRASGVTIKKRHPKIVERLAYHEAGHAIVAHHFGVEVFHVTISPDEEKGSEGETLLKHRAPSLHEVLLTYLGWPNRTKLEQMVVLMAGIEAVKLVRKQTNFSHRRCRQALRGRQGSG